MAKSISIPGGKTGDRIAEAFAAVYGYADDVPDPDNPGDMKSNPQSVEDFAVEKIKQFIVDTVAAHESNTAGDSARASAAEKVHKEIKL